MRSQELQAPEMVSTTNKNSKAAVWLSVAENTVCDKAQEALTRRRYTSAWSTTHNAGTERHTRVQNRIAPGRTGRRTTPEALTDEKLKNTRKESVEL